MLKTVKALFFLSIATLPRFLLQGLGELMLNPRTFFGLCCKDWGSRGDLSYVWCRGHWCSQALILIEVSGAHFAGP
ncbi:hypothetical protein glysoja_039458 [Glycine soja]|uniref:Uncharacterized protein n=1 Tax=Glycine soja TaxID=3848 RepID=A0A0B2RED8_GLYSO|nr:hypothetical protein glysoja_039458 [Glycine soja]